MKVHRAQAQALLDAALRILNNFGVRFRYETCPAALIDIAATATLVDALTAWGEQEIARLS